MSDVEAVTKIKQLEEMMQQLKNEVGQQDLKTTDEQYVAKLKEKLNSFLAKPSKEFERGDTVKWKKGLKNRKYPKEEQLCMVVDVLPEPKTRERDSGSPYFGEPLDLVLALLDDEKQDLLLFHYDKRRFEIVEKAKHD
jgi:hypothetical protein